MKEKLMIVVFILLGVLTRTVWHIAPNVEFVTALSLAGGYFFKGKKAFIIPFAIMVLSDLIIGNSMIFLFTWSAFILAPILSWAIKAKKSLKLGIESGVAGIIFTILFFLWTNFGVVVVSSMYPKTFEGVIQSYIMGLPFLLNQLVGNIIIVPSVFLLTNLVYKGHARIAQLDRATVL